MDESFHGRTKNALEKLARVLLVFALCGLRPAPEAQAADVLDPSDELLARGIQVRKHHVQGVEVLEVVLGRVEFDAPLPLVMRIHGRMSDWQLPAGSYANVARPYRLLVPRGTVQTGSRRSWAGPSVRSRKPKRLESEIASAADRLAGVLAHFRAHRRVVGEPIVTGFSQGGMVALAMGVRHPDAVGTVLPVAAHLVVPLEPARLHQKRLPEVHALHGGADRIVEPGPAEEARERLREVGFVSTLEVVPEVEHEVVGPLAEAHRALLSEALEAAFDARPGFGA